MKWMNFINWISQSASWLLVGVLLTALLTVIGVIIWKLKDNSVLAIVLTAGATVLITIPLVSTVNHLVELKAKNIVIAEKTQELENIKLKIENTALLNENLEKENEILAKEKEILEEEIKVNSLNQEINLLKASQASVNQFEKIAEVALIKANMQQTKVWHELLNTGKIDESNTWIQSIGKKINEQVGKTTSEYYDNKVLVVNTYEMDAKIGIDFNKIKVKKINDDKIQVSGIEPTYIGASKNVKTNHISEFRTNEYDADGTLRITTIDNTKQIQARDKEAEYDRDYQKSLQNMENWDFLTDAVVSLGENFIKMIFGGVYKDIEFVEYSDELFLPMEKYIETEIQNYIDETKSLTSLESEEKQL